MGDKINKAFKLWEQRRKDNYINAICKPCWELNYCPYGPIVEDFPLIEDDKYSCRVFGHLCPVYSVAEPFTETKKLRNISRNIPQSIKFKVFRRDNQVCQQCGKNVAFDEINFDHIIPWSKGGSSEERNIRLLCESCNKRRSDNFEDEHLIVNIKEIYHDPLVIDLGMLEDLLRLTALWFLIQKNEGSPPDEERYCEAICTDDVETDKFMYLLVSQIVELLSSEKPFIDVKRKMDALRFRWGAKDGGIHAITQTCDKFKIDLKYYIDSETLLLRRLGFVLKKDAQMSKTYYELKINLTVGKDADKIEHSDN